MVIPKRLQTPSGDLKVSPHKRARDRYPAVKPLDDATLAGTAKRDAALHYQRLHGCSYKEAKAALDGRTLDPILAASRRRREQARALVRELGIPYLDAIALAHRQDH